jgi:hypothetical protein
MKPVWRAVVDSALVTVSVSVPEDRVGELYEFAGRLCSNGSTETNRGTRWGFGREAVRKAYWGGTSDYWRPFLEELAANPDEWLAWHDLCAAIGLAPKQASGMLGAAERRLKGRPPFERSYEGGQYYFRMPSTVAEVINEITSEATK